jgi:hypothetical protein
VLRNMGVALGYVLGLLTLNVGSGKLELNCQKRCRTT